MRLKIKLRRTLFSGASRFTIAFAAFIAYIFAFAAYYSWVLDGHFRFEGVSHEESYERSKSEIIDYVTASLLSEKDLISDVIQASRVAFGKNDLVDIDLSLTIKAIDPGAIYFDGSYSLLDEKAVRELKRQEGCGDQFLHFGCLVEISVLRIPIGSCALTPETPFGTVSSMYCMGTGERNDTFFNFTGSNFGLYTFLSERRIQEILSFTRAETHLERGLFLRMLYFSAVTATTLGYGDIVPITTTARLSVAVQSVCGLFLMGWFVFWLTSNRKEGR